MNDVGSQSACRAQANLRICVMDVLAHCIYAGLHELQSTVRFTKAKGCYYQVVLHFLSDSSPYWNEFTLSCCL